MFSYRLKTVSQVTKSRTYQLLVLPCQGGNWGCTGSWEGTEPGQLTPAGKRDIPYCMLSLLINKTGEFGRGGTKEPLLLNWMSMNHQVVSSCIVHHLFCIFFITIISFLFCPIKLSLSQPMISTLLLDSDKCPLGMVTAMEAEQLAAQRQIHLGHCSVERYCCPGRECSCKSKLCGCPWATKLSHWGTLKQPGPTTWATRIEVTHVNLDWQYNYF